MVANRSRTLFDTCRQQQAAAGLTTTNEDTLICPICWQETEFGNFTLDHIVSRKVGGRAVVLTCAVCNNMHGSELDAHLVGYQATKDAFQGHGTLPAVINVNGKRMAANLKWEETAKSFVVVDKASNPREVAATREDFAAGLVSELNVTMTYAYATNNFQTAVLRSAYLALFERFGYDYAKHDVVQAIRRRICDRSLAEPNLSSLIIELKAARMPYDRSHLIVNQRIGEIDCFLVVIRVRRATTTYLGAFMPNTTHPIGHFDRLMDEGKRRLNGKQAVIAKRDCIV